VSGEVGNRKARAADSSVRSLLRSVGRVAIWIVLGVLLVRGAGAVLAQPHTSAASRGARSVASDQASTALAVHFARTYLGAVSQAEVSATQRLGGGREILTVACELRDGRTLYLAVPISRSVAGEVAVTGVPWVVAAPSVAGVERERPRPLAGPDAAAIRSLVEKFIPAYLSARSPEDLSYLLAPGASVAPLAGSLELLGAFGAVSQLGEGEGRRRTVLVGCRLRYPASGAVYRLAYRLRVVKRNRWYVEAVEGGLS
jgi:Conjugative transposon protein TcpC